MPAGAGNQHGGDLGAAMAAFGWQDASAHPVEVGLINATYRIERDGRAIAALQQLHPVFSPEVNIDIEAVTRHLETAGHDTPTIVRTARGALWADIGERPWRALTWIDGTTVEAIPSADWAVAAGAMVGRFHRALADFEHEFAFVRTGVHDTAAHLSKLAAVAAASKNDAADTRSAASLSRDIAAAATQLPALTDLPARVCHGDLKVSNILFDPGPPPRGRCLIDLDTLGHQIIAHELGDAFRSWCNPVGESSDAPTFDVDLFEAAMSGYRAATGDWLETREWRSIGPGIETICVELAARFCTDAFEDCYFGWDAERYDSRRQHNLVRARCQLSLARSVHQQRAQIDRIAAS